MSDKNQIGNLIFDLSFDSEQNAYAFQTDVESFVRNELLREIDEVFEQLDEKDKIIRIKSLDLDLGSVSYLNCKNEIREKVKCVLYEKLKDEIARAKQNPSSDIKTIQKGESDTDLLIHFLGKGELPWNDSGRNINFNEIVKNSLKASNKLIAWFRRIGKQQFIRRRFIEQFSDASILELINHLDKSNHEFYKDYAEDLHFTYRKNPISGSNESEFRSIVWDLILAFLLNKRGSHFNQKSFVESTLIGMARQLGIAYSMLLNQFLDVLNQLESQSMYCTDFPVIIKELGVDLKKPEKELEELNEKEKWISLLQSAFQNKQSNFSNLFVDLAENYPSDLISCLQQMVLKQEDRSSLIELLSNTQLKKLIILLQAVEADFIIGFIENLQFEELREEQEIRESHFKKAKWELGLAYLFEERGSTFNRKSFVKHTIYGIASHYNLSPDELVLSLYAEMDGNTYSKFEQVLLKEILEEMKSDLEENRDLRNKQGVEENKILKEIEYFEYLVNYLRGRTSILNYEISAGFGDEGFILIKISKESPDLLSRFLAFVFAPNGLDLLLKNTSIKFIHSFIGICMTHYQSATNENIDAFLEAVSQHVSQTNHKIAFYTRIVTDIINSKDINLAEIIGEINQFEKNLLAMDVNSPIDFLSMRTHLIDLIKGNPGSGLIQKNLAESWNYILEVYPERISQILQLIVLNDTTLNSFINNTTKDLLLKIVDSLGKTNRDADGISLLLSIVNKQGLRLDEAWKSRFWKTSILLLVEMRDTKAEQITTQIFLRFWMVLKVNKEKKKWLQVCDEIVQQLKNKNRKAMASQIDTLIVRLKSELKGASPVQHDEQNIKDETISYLKGGIEAIHSPQILHKVILSLMKDEPNKMAEFFWINFRRSSVWIKQLPESILLRVIYLLFPKEFLSIQYLSDLIWKTSSSVAKQEFAGLDAQLKHVILFDCIGKLKNQLSTKSFASLILYETMKQLPNSIRESVINNLERFVDSNYHDSQNKETALLIEAIQDHQKQSFKSESTGSENPQQNREEINYNSDDIEDPTEKIYIDNAGMVLANPYLPELFKRLHLLNDKEFKDRESAEKAIHILQYMVNETCNSPEYKLLLNKILCGIKTGIPIKQSAEISNEDKQLVDGLVQVMISNWKAIRNTSVNGLRESFLQREGVLYKEDDCWQLQIETRAYDMLLDQLPWAFNTIKYPWMKNVLYVKWR